MRSEIIEETLLRYGKAEKTELTHYYYSFRSVKDLSRFITEAIQEKDIKCEAPTPKIEPISWIDDILKSGYSVHNEVIKQLCKKLDELISVVNRMGER